MGQKWITFISKITEFHEVRLSSVNCIAIYSSFHRTLIGTSLVFCGDSSFANCIAISTYIHTIFDPVDYNFGTLFVY